MTTKFIPGIELCRQFYHIAVQPILAREFPGLRYDAALIGHGSEVLGFDDARSTDHNWGPRVMLFVSDEQHAQVDLDIRDALRRGLPTRFRGYSTGYYRAAADDSMMPTEVVEGDVPHLVTVGTVRGLLREYLAFEWGDSIRAVDWLTFPAQKLRTLIAGGVYHSGLGEITAMRAAFADYPQDVWLYLLACGWARIGQEEPFVGRTGDTGDDTGSAVIAARLVRDIMRLCFLMERVYAPYPKWFGTAFKRLACADTLTPHLDAVLAARTWQEREKHLSHAYQVIAQMHNTLGITDPLADRVSSFWSRPYRVIHGDHFADAIIARITDPDLKRIADHTRIGGIDQFTDNTDMLENAAPRSTLTLLYG